LSTYWYLTAFTPSTFDLSLVFCHAPPAGVRTLLTMLALPIKLLKYFSRELLNQVFEPALNTVTSHCGAEVIIDQPPTGDVSLTAPSVM
jgi:hypothetical protein